MSQDDIKESLINAIRILDKGIAMERNARDFYARAARITESKEGRRMFKWLAQFEVGHKIRLEAKKKEVLEHPVLKDYDPHALGEYKVSEADEAVDMAEDMTDSEILKIAIENEKRAYSFYQKKMTFASDPTLRDMFDDMARDEERHVIILTEQLEHIEINHLWQDMENIEEIIRSSEEKY